MIRRYFGRILSGIVVVSGLGIFFLIPCKTAREWMPRPLARVQTYEALDNYLVKRRQNISSRRDRIQEVPEHFETDRSKRRIVLDERKIELGRFLFYDERLSKHSNISCESCHKQAFGFSDNRANSIGSDGTVGMRKSMPLANLAYDSNFFWDGRVKSVKLVALEPLFNPAEHALDADSLTAKIRGIQPYRELFVTIYGNEPNPEIIADAIGEFLQTLVSFSADIDLLERQSQKLNTIPNAKQSLVRFTFESMPKETFNILLNCSKCHNAPLLGRPAGFFDIGLNRQSSGGLGAVTGKQHDQGAFKAPSLRNIAVRAPYMHDGRFKTIKEVLTHYDRSIQISPNLSNLLKSPNGHAMRLNLTEEQSAFIEEYLTAFTDHKFLQDRHHASPYNANSVFIVPKDH